MKDNDFKVCLLNDSFPPTVDGVANTVVNYASIIDKHHGTPIVVTPKYPKVTDNYPYDVIRYTSFKTQKALGYRAGYPFSNRVLHKVENADIDIIHSHCPAVSTMVARSIQRVSNVPLVFTYHTKFDIEVKKFMKTKTLQNTLLKMIVDNVSSCDEVWVVSEGAGKNLRSLGYKGDYRIMENGVDFPRGLPAESLRSTAAKKYGIRHDVTKFLFVGRMNWYKGIDLILKSLKALADRGTDFQMVFAGGGLDFIQIKARAKEYGLSEKCVFTGVITDREELRAVFSLCDLFLFPSLYDTNGIVVREAAACGIPSVLVKGSCASEGIVDMETGFLIENTVQGMVSKLEHLLENPNYIKGVGENAQNKIYLSWEDSVSKAVERYRFLIDNYHPKTFKHTGHSSDRFYNLTNHVYNVRSKFYKK